MKTIHDNDKTSRNIEKAYNNHHYIVSFRSVYQPFYSQAQQSYYAQEVYHAGKEMPLTQSGRFFHMTGKAVNHLIGIELLADL